MNIQTDGLNLSRPIENPNLPEEVILDVPNSEKLDRIYYAVARQSFAGLEIFYEYQMNEGSRGDFQIVIPKPSGPLDSWSLLLFGYKIIKNQNQLQRVLESETNVAQYFSSRLLIS